MRFEELTPGLSAEFGKTITDADVVLFAGVTGDFNPVHVNGPAAERTRFGGRIAHGMLGAGLISAVLGTQLPGPGCIYMNQTLRFTAPVRIGDTVTARVEVLELVPAKRRARLATVCRNQRGETVIEGEALVMIPEETAIPSYQLSLSAISQCPRTLLADSRRPTVDSCSHTLTRKEAPRCIH